MKISPKVLLVAVVVYTITDVLVAFLGTTEDTLTQTFIGLSKISIVILLITQIPKQRLLMRFVAMTCIAYWIGTAALYTINGTIYYDDFEKWMGNFHEAPVLVIAFLLSIIISILIYSLIGKKIIK